MISCAILIVTLFTLGAFAGVVAERGREMGGEGREIVK